MVVVVRLELTLPLFVVCTEHAAILQGTTGETRVSVACPELFNIECEPLTLAFIEDGPGCMQNLPGANSVTAKGSGKLNSSAPVIIYPEITKEVA